jgi:S1/P1 Nuclease
VIAKLRNCIIEAIAWYVQMLKSPDPPRNEKRTPLRFLAHLLGDIHQPLHAGLLRIAAGTVLTCPSTLNEILQNKTIKLRLGIQSQYPWELIRRDAEALHLSAAAATSVSLDCCALPVLVMIFFPST